MQSTQITLSSGLRTVLALDKGRETLIVIFILNEGLYSIIYFFAKTIICYSTMMWKRLG